MEKKTIDKIEWGEIYLCDLGNMKGSVQCGLRPVLVIQTNNISKYSPTVTVAVITSVLKKENMQTHIILNTDCGLKEKSMVMLEQIRTIDKNNELIKYVGKIEDAAMISKIKDGIRYQFQLVRPKRPARSGRIITLCPRCRTEIMHLPDIILKRIDPLQHETECCEKCQTGYGYDYFVFKKKNNCAVGGFSDV